MSKRHLIDLIKKTAQELEDAPGVVPQRRVSVSPNVPEAPEGGTIPSVHTKPISNNFRSADIIKMQEALKSLADTVTAEINIQALNKEDQKGSAKAMGRMSFADFITQHYTRGSDIPGIEYDLDPKKTLIEEKDPSKPTRTNVVMDTMERVGGPKSEFKVDGVWGPRTNASLRNSYALAYGLLAMSKDFKYQPKDYSDSNLQELKRDIPLTPESLSYEEKTAKAKEITPHLLAIKKLYNEVKEHILEKPAYKSYIDGSTPYEHYSPGGPINPALIDYLGKKFSGVKVSGTINGKPSMATININDLASKESLQAWKQKNMSDTPTTNILDQIKKYLDNLEFKPDGF